MRAGARAPQLAQRLGKAAFESSVDRKRVTPYSRSATEAFDMVYTGGKKVRTAGWVGWWVVWLGVQRGGAAVIMSVLSQNAHAGWLGVAALIHSCTLPSHPAAVDAGGGSALVVQRCC